MHSSRSTEEVVVPPAARVGDPTGHPGVIGPPGVPTVLIAGQPAATVGTPHICSFPPPPPHPPSAIVGPGSATVLIGGMPAARIGDMSACGAPIVSGALTVLIGG
ncbi:MULTISPECIES: PAAR domain-containing protein [Rhodococcus]|uniref:PAAR domain-containing protein n=1 Tax=Rhodococcus TaxID=1827 RepID=UPI003003054C